MVRSAPLPPDVRRSQLLDAARTVFAENGYHRASVSDIIKQAGVARGTFYNYFESKRSVFDAVLSNLMERILAVIQPIGADQPIVDQVHDNFRRIVRALYDEGKASRILFTDASGIDPESDMALREFYQQATERIATALQVGQSWGVVRPCDVSLVALCLLGMVKEPVFQSQLQEKPLDVDRLVDEQLAIFTAAILVHTA